MDRTVNRRDAVALIATAALAVASSAAVAACPEG